MRLRIIRRARGGKALLVACVATAAALTTVSAAGSARTLGGGLAATQASTAQGVLGTEGSPADHAYPPDGPDFPNITLNEGPQGAAGLPPLHVPKPHGFNKQSIWNMKKVGFNGNQGRCSSDDGWVEDQNGRYILYVSDNGCCPTPAQAGPCPHYNPLTGKKELDGTSLIDVTNPKHPVFIAHIPSTTGSSAHLAVCGGNTLPNAAAKGLTNRWFLLRPDGSKDWQVFETTDPSHPKLLTTVISNGTDTHHVWWECDTGVAYLVFEQQGDGWHFSGAHQHLWIFDLSNPAKPKFIREFGLPGQQPSADVATQKSCYNDPSNTCYEGVVNPPAGVHNVYSAGVNKNRVYIAYNSSTDGMDQILNRNKLINGCNRSFNPAASAHCATDPTQADLLYPQISYLTQNPLDGGHTFVPIYGVPIPQEQRNFLNAPVKRDLAVNISEATTNDCFGQKWKNPSIIDISNELAPYPISTATVGQFPGNFCAKGSRFGTHEVDYEIYAPYYGRLLITSFFNAGIQVFDIRDPYNPRRVAYFIQAPNENTITTCGTYQGNTHYCRRATFADLAVTDNRGYIYSLDRAGSGVTILKPTGAAAKVVTGQGGQGK